MNAFFEDQPKDVIIQQLRADIRVADAMIRQLTAVIHCLEMIVADGLTRGRSAEAKEPMASIRSDEEYSI